MRSVKAAISIVAALALIAALVLVQYPAYRAVGAFRAFVKSFADRSFSYEELSRIRTELAALRAERAALLEAGIPPFSADLKKISVYSRYPYGAEGLLTIAAGSDQGLREGLPVLAAPGALLGVVVRVDPARSEVRTIFNPAWRSTVRFEKSGAEALLEGGSAPQLTLIPNEGTFFESERVVNADASFPYGLFMGVRGGDEGIETDDPWRTAPLELTYRESDLREVLVVTNFP
ncbi:MAG: hypothetical protein HYU81_03045 [Candidatus Brennerbacteria bacterium]|nr:hypothetical protein [Candidatus Brennerbacteria bacterium]